MLAVQCKMARAALGLGVRELAEKASVSPDTIARLERGEPLKERTVAAIQAALESAGVIFVAENGEGPGVRLRKGVAATPAASASSEQRQAGADHARRKAGKAADRALVDVDASDDEKTARRGALTDEPALVVRAREKGRN